MNLTILAVGKVKESYFRDALAEYQKRLTKYCKIHIIEVPDEQTPDGASSAIETEIRRVEGERILKKLKKNDYVIAMAIDGKKFNSVDFSEHMGKLFLNGESSLVFVIGGSLGLHDCVFARADEKISFSDLTFPHQLMRVILAEQIYRSFRIMNKEPYHK